MINIAISLRENIISVFLVDYYSEEFSFLIIIVKSKKNKHLFFLVKSLLMKQICTTQNKARINLAAFNVCNYYSAII